ncbi:hypothetical protein ACX1C1_13060 [Paenibacillus sp. strain BS8-2]
MNREQDGSYERFVAAEKDRFLSGPVTKEERAAFERELRLLRAFRLTEHVGPNAWTKEESP